MNDLRRLKISKIERHFSSHNNLNSSSRNSQFAKLISEIGNLLPKLYSQNNNSTVLKIAVGKEELVSTMKELLNTCVSCELLLPKLFGVAIGLKPTESYNLVLSDIDKAAEKWTKLTTQSELLDCGLKISNKINEFYVYSEPLISDPRYTRERINSASSQALSHLMVLIKSCGYTITDVVEGSISKEL